MASSAMNPETSRGDASSNSAGQFIARYGEENPRFQPKLTNVFQVAEFFSFHIFAEVLESELFRLFLTFKGILDRGE